MENKKKCKKCQSELFQDNNGKWFCLSCLANKIDHLDNENEVKGEWTVITKKTKPVTIRLSEDDLFRAKQRSKVVHRPYQTIIKEIIHNALM